ncbi:hypothetical protein [Streptomyces sp. 1331.2]|uniref:hypothetical protein n=1 Tax=Streptomyces sp. 1331.2 TaxID=1938835 RepID=UPI0015CF4B69|nr:hypothetical protein [Streptomyces sp. 1331.2]
MTVSLARSTTLTSQGSGETTEDHGTAPTGSLRRANSHADSRASRTTAPWTSGDVP